MGAEGAEGAEGAAVAEAGLEGALLRVEEAAAAGGMARGWEAVGPVALQLMGPSTCVDVKHHCLVTAILGHHLGHHGGLHVQVEPVVVLGEARVLRQVDGGRHREGVRALGQLRPHLLSQSEMSTGVT